MPHVGRAAERLFFLDLLSVRATARDRLPLLYALDRPPAALVVPGREGATGTTAASDPWTMAVKWSREGRKRRAVESAVRAAQRSLRERNTIEAARRFSFAIRHVDRKDPQRAALRQRQAEAFAAAGWHHAAARRFGLAASDAKHRAELLALRSHALSACGQFERARSAAVQALDAARDARARAHAGHALSIALARSGRLAEARTVLDEARARLERGAPAANLDAEIRQSLGLLRLRLGEPEAADDLRAALERFGEADRSGRGLGSRAGLVLIEARTGRPRRAERLLDEVRTLATDQDRPELLEATLSSLASTALEQGRLDRGLELSREALAVASRAHDAELLLADRCRLADALCRCGRPGEAVSLLRDGLRDHVEGPGDALADLARVFLACALGEAGSPGAEGTAQMLLERALPRLRRHRETWAFHVGLATEMERRARPGCPDPLDPVSAEFDTWRARNEPDAETAIRAELARAQADLHRGRPEDARRAAAAAGEIARREGRQLPEAAAQTLLWKSATQLADEEGATRAADRARRLLEACAEKIGDESVRRDLLGQPPFVALQKPPGVSLNADRRLLALYEMIHALNSESDPDALLESILDMTLRVVGAERGVILLKDASGNDFTVKIARNLERETARDARTYSSTIVREAGTGKSLLVNDAQLDERFRKAKSVSLYHIRSLMCVPLRLRGEIIGTVYLDSRTRAGLFSRADLRFLEAFADHATIALENLRRQAELERENRRLEAVSQTRVRFGNLVGRAPAMQRVFDLIEKFSASELPVLIRGESGTGKELVARAIHANGPRRRKVFLSENCAAIPDSLLETELFGHVKGAFTGAERDRPGLFQQADGGTLFLDEVGDMSPAMQSKLLRVLQEGIVRRVGDERTFPVDVRVLAATHRDLEAEVAAGTFREDLYYRLQVLVTTLPPLRDRPGDISLLAEHLLTRIAGERGTPPPRLTREVVEALERYAWPGNVRQLENALQRLCLLAGDGPITLDVVRADAGLQKTLMPFAEGRPATLSLAQSERERIAQALRATGGNRDRAARLLGVSRATIYRKLKRYGLG